MMIEEPIRIRQGHVEATTKLYRNLLRKKIGAFSDTSFFFPPLFGRFLLYFIVGGVAAGMRPALVLAESVIVGGSILRWGFNMRIVRQLLEKATT
jgi:hypothetical protein